MRANCEQFDDANELSQFLDKLLKNNETLYGFFVTNSRSYKIVECLEQITDRKIKIVGFDLIEENLKYFRRDKINFLINQNPSEQGFLGIMNLFKHLILKENVDKKQYLPLDIVVKENVDYYLKRQQSFEVII